MKSDAPCLKLAAQFASLIIDQDYVSAWSMLTHAARSTQSPESIQAAVEAMISYASGPILAAQIVESATVEAWPGKKPEDLAVVYVALTGAGFSEAVTLTLTREAGNILIRDLTWGRP